MRAGQGNLGNGNAATTWMSYLMAREHSQPDPDTAGIFMLWDSAPSDAPRIDEHTLTLPFITTAVSYN